MNEEWRLVPGSNGVMVSNLGRIKDANGDIKNQYFDDEGYRRISFKRNGKSQKHLVHRLVAEVFLKNPQNKPFVNHKNGNKADNCWTNLEYCTPRENSLLASKNGQLKHGRGATEVVATNVKTGEKTYYCSQSQAARAIGCGDSEVNKAIKRKRRTTHGYQLDYLNKADVEKSWVTNQERQLSLFDFMEGGVEQNGE